MARKGLRKRFLVSEGDLFTLFKEVMQIRNFEMHEAYYGQFRKLITEAQGVKLTVIEPPTVKGGEE